MGVDKSENLEVFESAQAPNNFLEAYTADHRLLDATQGSIDEFDIRYLYIRKNGKNIFVTPVFYTVFKVTTMSNSLWLQPFLRLLEFKIAGVGNPIMGFAHYEGEISPEIIQAITAYLNKKSNLVVFKGFNPHSAFNHFVHALSLPVAVLNFDLVKWKALQQSRNISRKIKDSKNLVYQFKTKLTQDELDRIYFLYSQTYSRASIQFGKLQKSYYEKSNGQCTYVLTYLNKQIVSFAQIFEKDKSAVATFMGMDYTVDKKLGLYFGTYFGIMQWAEINQIQLIEFGETAYQFKRRIGCTIHDSWIFYAHKNRLIHFILSKLKFLVEPSKRDLL